MVILPLDSQTGQGQLLLCHYYFWPLLAGDHRGGTQVLVAGDDVVGSPARTWW